MASGPVLLNINLLSQQFFVFFQYLLFTRHYYGLGLLNKNKADKNSCCNPAFSLAGDILIVIKIDYF